MSSKQSKSCNLNLLALLPKTSYCRGGKCLQSCLPSHFDFPHNGLAQKCRGTACAMQYFSSLSHLIHVVHKYRACSSKFVCEKLTPKNVSNTTNTILLRSFFTLHLITLHPGLSFTKRICKGDFLFQQCAKNCLLAHLGITLPPYPQIGKIVFAESIQQHQLKISKSVKSFSFKRGLLLVDVP